MMVVHGGASTDYRTDGSLATLRLARGSATFSVERDLGFDLLMWRHLGRVRAALLDFNPDIIHVTSPGDIGLLGLYLSHTMRIPLVASWHTNLHEFAATRLENALHSLPASIRRPLVRATERQTLRLVDLFYSIPRVLLAPNVELVKRLRRQTGKPVCLMSRGVEADVFTSEKRTTTDGIFRVGYVGRLTPEKNVRLLVEAERAFTEAGIDRFTFSIVGDGSELSWLKRNLRHAEFHGILRGEALAEAYANMDLFAFPSHTDTFGNVVLEAMASGVPAVVTSSGGPRFLVKQGMTGWIAADNPDFVAKTVMLAQRPALRQEMRTAARRQACTLSWDRVFEDLYDAYALVGNCAADSRSIDCALPESR